MRKKTPRQQLIDLYDDAIKENLQNKYVVHCTDGKRVVDESQRAMDEEYIQAMQSFGKKLSEVTDPLEERLEDMRWDNMQARMGDDF